MAPGAPRQPLGNQEKEGIMNSLRPLLVAVGLALPGAGLLLPPADARADSSHHQVREIEIVVRKGYQPSRIEIVAGEHIQLKFVRRESGDCSSEVVFPALGIRQTLPEGKPVIVHVPDLAPGEYEFKCGMGMISGKLVVRPKP
jgi:plastocyanin domain-containing protein